MNSTKQAIYETLRIVEKTLISRMEIEQLAIFTDVIMETKEQAFIRISEPNNGSSTVAVKIADYPLRTLWVIVYENIRNGKNVDIIDNGKIIELTW